MGKKFVSKSSGVDGFFSMGKGREIQGILQAYNEDPGGDAGPFFALKLTKDCDYVKVKNDEDSETYDETQVDEDGDVKDWIIVSMKKGSMVGVSRVNGLKGLEDEAMNKKVTIKVTGTRKSRKKSFNDSYVLDVEIDEV